MGQYTCTILLFLLFSISKLAAQSFDEKDFILYTKKEGLSSNDIHSITQDQYGYMWIATKKGLNRFDGNTFQHYYSDSNRNSLPQDWVFKLKWIDKEQLAAITTAGLHIINTKTLKKRNLAIPADSLGRLAIVNYVWDALGDEKGNVFVLSRTGFYQFDKKDKLVFRYDHYSRNFIETKVARFGLSMIMLNNTILIGSEDGLYIYQIAQKDIHPVNANDESFYRSIASPQAFKFLHKDESSFSVKKDSTRELFFFDIQHKTNRPINAAVGIIDEINASSNLVRLNDSLYAINGSDGGFYIIRYDRESNSYNLRPNRYFENDWCSALFVDNMNHLWVGTKKGLFRQKRFDKVVEQIAIPFTGPATNSWISAIATSNDKVFVGTINEGLFIFGQDSLNEVKKIDFSKYGRGNNFINIITPIHKDTLFLGTSCYWINSRNLIHGKLDIPGMKKDDGAKAILKDSRNNVFISATMNGKFYFRKANDDKFVLLDFSDNDLFNIGFPMFISEDPGGNLWFGGSGMSRYNYSSRTIDIKLDSFPAIKLARRSITSNVMFDKAGNMYFGVYENGLIIYDANRKAYSQLTRNDGLPDNSIWAVCVVGNKLWMGTENGLANYDLSTKKISSFGSADNIPPEGSGTYSFFYDSVHQKLYAAYNNTIIRFNPDKLIKNNSPPSFFIESIVVAGEETIYHPDNKINLSYKLNNIVVNLTAINFEDAYQQQFAYRFVSDGTEEWHETGSQRNIIFSSLPYGRQRLQVKVFVKNNSWPEQVKELIIYVNPPFWKTTWFILLMSVLLLAGLSAFFLFRIKNIRRRANIDKQLAEIEMKALHAQMNPHFIFNSLNSIKEMILEDEKQNASRYLSKFAQLIRTNLEQSRQTFITLKQCIDHLHQYLEMERIRFEGFTYNIDAETNLVTDEIHIAPMLIQPLVENAIWHGLHNKKGDKHLHIQFYRSGDQLVCEIDDNGIGIKRSNANRSGMRPAHRSLGISNIHERLVILNEKYKMNCSLKITDKSDSGKQNESGTKAVLRVNI